MTAKETYPLVSIVTPAYNSARTIGRTIESVSAQDYPNVEHIVVDGKSSDETISILKANPQIDWISEPDSGQSDAINKGFRMARGSILAWLNADDTYNSQAISTAVRWLTSNPQVDLVHSDYRVIDEHDRTLYTVKAIDFALDQLFLTNELPGQFTAFWKRRVLNRVGFLDTNLHYMMDYEYWLRIAMGGVIKHIPNVYLANFRLCPGTKTHSRPEAFRIEADQILSHVLEGEAFLSLPPSVQDRARASALRHRALVASYQNDPMSAAEHFREANRYFADLRRRDIEVISGGLGECARSPLVQDALALVRTLFSQPLPPNIAHLQRQVLGRVHHTYALDLFQRGEWRASRRHMILSFVLLPALMRNRGMWSVMVQSLLGPKSS